jgi:hypothetical protein
MTEIPLPPAGPVVAVPSGAKLEPLPDTPVKVRTIFFDSLRRPMDMIGLNRLKKNEFAAGPESVVVTGLYGAAAALCGVLGCRFSFSSKLMLVGALALPSILTAAAAWRHWRKWRGVVVYETRELKVPVGEREIDSFVEQEDIRLFPLSSGEVERQAREVEVEIVRLESNGFALNETTRAKMRVSETLVEELTTPRVSPQALIGEDAAIDERMQRYLSKVTHVNTSNKGFLMQNSGEYARLIIAERANEWMVHRPSQGFHCSAS